MIGWRAPQAYLSMYLSHALPCHFLLIDSNRSLILLKLLHYFFSARPNGSGKDTRGPANSRAPWCCCGCIDERRGRGRGWERCGTIRRNGGISGIGTAATFRWCARFEVREDRLLPYPEGELGVFRWSNTASFAPRAFPPCSVPSFASLVEGFNSCR